MSCFIKSTTVTSLGFKMATSIKNSIPAISTTLPIQQSNRNYPRCTCPNIKVKVRDCGRIDWPGDISYNRDYCGPEGTCTYEYFYLKDCSEANAECLTKMKESIHYQKTLQNKENFFTI